MTIDAADRRPILIVPYMWVGDFVRCHTVVRVLNARWPQRPVDILATKLTAQLARFMPGVRKAVVSNLPRGSLALSRQRRLAAALATEGYGTALVMPRTWKAALAPLFARIPERVGFFGEGRLLLLNDLRRGERALPRMVDRCAALALPRGTALPAEWPLPQLIAAPAEVSAWRARLGLGGTRPVVALAPGAVGPGKRWPAEKFGALAAALADQDLDVWILGGPDEKAFGITINDMAGGRARDLTGDPLDESVLAFAAASAAVANDSGLLHVAAAVGAPAVGLFGPTDPALWGPLNPLAGTVRAPLPSTGDQRRVEDISPDTVLAAVEAALASKAS